MKYSLYLVSALLLISCVSGGGYGHHHSQPKELVLDDLANELLQFGINFIFQTAADQYGVSTDGVQVTRVNHVRWFPIDNPITLYKFNVDAANSDGDRVWTWFEVNYNRDTREMTMGKWRYEVYFNMNFEGFLNEEASLESAIDEGQVGGGGSEVEGETEQDIETEVETGVEIETGVNEEGTVANNEDFEEVPQDEIENDTVIQDVLDDGAAFIFNRAANRFGVSKDNVEVTNVNSVFRKADDENNRTIYRIHFDATNNDGATVEARLFVDHNNETGENNVVGHWRYLIQFGVSGNEEGSLLEEESILEFDMNDGLDDVL